MSSGALGWWLIAGGLAAACGRSELAGGQVAGESADAGAGASAGLACVVRVAEAGSDANSGGEWSLALRTVQRGLDAARSLKSSGVCPTVEIWVAGGTYTPSQPTDPLDARTATFQLVPAVALYGSFAGTESARADRRLPAYGSVLSGDLGTPSGHSYHVVTGATGATLDGFTIVDGLANGPSPQDRGGGMYDQSVSPSVSNCTFIGNGAAAGAGMYNESSSPTVTNCTFADNAAVEGGAMYDLVSSPIVTGSTFTNNAGYIGGAMSNISSSPVVTNSTFLGNSAYLGGGMSNDSAFPVVTNCTFAGNSASGSATFTGEMLAAGGAMYNDDASSPTVTSSTFARNSAEYSGGGIQNSRSSPTIANSILWGDTVGTGVSEIINADSDSFAAVTDCIVQGNYPSDTHIITADPLFVDAPGGDLRLQPGSPAIDAGDGCGTFVTPVDQSGNRRWDIARVTNVLDGLDLGALEYQGSDGIDRAIFAFECP
jgi:hypothetical protein